MASVTLRAEMSGDDYQAGAQRLSPAERAREAARIAQEREAAARAEREREAREAEARRQLEAARAARPLGVRLVEARCGGCHATDYISMRRYGQIGWWATVLRMELVNGAELGSGERGEIIAHLAATYPAPAVRQAMEWALVLGAGVGAAASIWWLVRRADGIMRRGR